MAIIDPIIKELSRQTYIIDSDKYEHIVSLPLREVAFSATSEGAEVLRNALWGSCTNVDGEAENLLRELYARPAKTPCPQRKESVFSSAISIILTQRCNFECTYCFAHDARGKETMTREDVRFIIDSWAAQPVPHNKVTFIGGGEPTVVWKLLEWSIGYIRKTIGDAQIVLVTNGSLISHDRLLFLKEAKVQISLSFDILPEIQEGQRRIYHSGRSSFQAVDSFLKDVARINAEAGENDTFHVGVRSTITPDIVEKMTDMVRFVRDNYAGVVRKIHFEHVTSPDNPATFYSLYEEEFFKARTVGREAGIEVFNSLTTSQGKVRSSFCLGESCFVPAGDDGILCTACHRISSPKDSMIGMFKYAESYEHGEFRCHEAGHEDLRGVVEECQSCPARWQCAGGCIMERLVLPPDLIRKKCEMVRGFNRRLLEEKLNDPQKEV